MGLNFRNHLPDAVHDVFERAFDRHRFQPVPIGMAQRIRGPGAANQGFGGHAAGIEAIAAHLVLFYQGNLRFHRRRYIGRDQTGGTTANDQQVVVEMRGFLPAGIHFAAADEAHHKLGNQGKETQQCKGQQQVSRDNVAGGLNLPQLGAGVYVNKRARQHGNPAHHGIGAQLHGGQAHGQVDQEKREHRYKPQGGQVEGTIFFDATVHFRHCVSVTFTQRIPHQETSSQERQRGSNGRG